MNNYCRNCGEKLAIDNIKVCPNCGVEIFEERIDVEKAKASLKEGNNYVNFIFLLMAILLICLFTGVLEEIIPFLIYALLSLSIGGVIKYKKNKHVRTICSILLIIFLCFIGLVMIITFQFLKSCGVI